MAKATARASRKGTPPGPPARRRRLVGTFGQAGIDALLVTNPANVRYLSGFTGEDSYLLVGRRWAVLLTDRRFEEQARLDCPDVAHHFRIGKMVEAIRAALKGRKVRRLGVEKEHIALGLHEQLGQAIGVRRLRPTEGLAGPLRLVKDGSELQAIRRAVKAAQDAFLGLIAHGKKKALLGRTEQSLAAELEYRMRVCGAEGASFPSIVAIGAHAALPHYRPGPTRVREGQAILFDWGARWGGYCSDLTRVVFVGRIPPRIGRVYEVVLAAQKAGISAVRAGRTLKAVDAAAREVITSAALGERFGHGLGHGIGLEIHEAPGLSPRAEGRLKRGSVVTIEPGVYLPGVGGVRIEDDVLVEKREGTVLSSLPKELYAMVLR